MILTSSSFFRMIGLAVSVFTVTAASFAYAAPLTAAQRAQGVTAEDLDANPKKMANLTTTLNRGAESRFKFDGTVSYGLRQDLAQDRSPGISTHRVLGLASMTILDRPVVVGFDDELAGEIATFNLVASAQWKTVGHEVQGNVHGGPTDAADVDVSVSRGFPFERLWNASNLVDASVGTYVPTSESTRYEGIIAAPYASLGWTLGFQGGRYTLNQSISADYVVNTYEFSPVSREVNPDYSGGYAISTSARLGAGFRFTVGGSARLVHHLDNSVTDALANFQILSWTKGFATVTLRHANGARAEDHLTNMWFVDEYRRVVSLGLSVRF